MNKTVMSKTRTSERGQGKLPSNHKRLKRATHDVAVDREVEILDPIDKYITVMGTAVSPEDGSTKGVVVKFNANNLPPHVIEPNLLFSTSAAEVGAWLFQVGIGNLADEMSTREFGGRVRRKADGKKVVVIDRDGYHKFQDGGKEVAGYVYGGKYHPFGTSSARVVLVGPAADAVEIKGTVKSWNRAFRKYLSNNPRMLVVVCVSLASAIIAAFGRDGMVIAIIGPTSTGKSTTERMSASMIGAKDHVIKWDATAIGMTELVAENRDKPSMVEDMQEADSIGDVCRLAMNIGSSSSRRRSKHVSQRQSQNNEQIRTNLVLSAEQGILGLAAKSRKSVNPGVLARYFEIGMGQYGVFDDLCGHVDGAELSKAIDAEAVEHKAALWSPWIEALSENWDQVSMWHREWIGDIREEILTAAERPVMDAVTSRMVDSLTFSAFAGCVASKLGVLSVERSLITASYGLMVSEHVARQPRSATSQAQDAIDAIRGYLQSHQSNFVSLTKFGNPNSKNGIVGFTSTDKTYGLLYLFPVTHFREKFEKQFGSVVYDYLRQHDFLALQKDRGNRFLKRVPVPAGEKPKRSDFIAIKGAILYV